MWPFKRKRKVNILLVISTVFLSLVFISFIIYIIWPNQGIRVEDLTARREASAGPLIIQTDKNKYSQGEIVKISYSNQAFTAMAEATSTELSIESSRFLGNNYGVGLIEQYFNGQWLAIEPVWRCSLDCFSPCREDRKIPSSSMKTFYWKQTKLVCPGSGDEAITVNVDPGRYRIVSAAWDSGVNDYKMIYSNQFEIK
jgi:hypothetical protein